MFVYVRNECVFCVIFFLPGHMDQVVEAGEVGVLIDNRVRLLVLKFNEFMARSREVTHQTVLRLAEGNVRQPLLPSFLLRHAGQKTEHVNSQGPVPIQIQ